MPRHAASIAMVLLLACSEGPFVLGAVDAPGPATCPPETDCQGRFELDFTAVGTDGFDSVPLAVGDGLLLRGEAATTDQWPSEGGDLLMAAEGMRLDREGPFTDGTRGVSATTRFEAGRALIDPGARDLLVEVLFRAGSGSVFTQHDGSRGVRLGADGDTLALVLDDGSAQATLRTEALTAGAWMHCVFLARHGTDSSVTCNGTPRAAPPIATGDLSAGAPSTVGGEGDLAIAWLLVAPFDTDIQPQTARDRFYAMTGARPRLAGGSADPIGSSRASAAFVDVQQDASAPRRLHLVGPSWPRVACRIDGTGARFCGYLAENDRSSAVPRDPTDWESVEAVAMPGGAAFATDLWAMTAIVPTAAIGEHGVRFPHTSGGSSEAFSFYARAGSSTELEVRVEGSFAVAVDLASASAVSADGAVARIEDWGEGLVRVILELEDVGPGPFEVLARSGGSTTFAGDGTTPAVHLAGLQSEHNTGSATTLLFAEEQPGDELLFEGGPGNLPDATSGTIRADVLTTDARRIHDQVVVDLNRDGGMGDWLSLFVTVGRSLLFYGFEEGAGQWTMGASDPIAGGIPTRIEASWGAAEARLQVGGAEPLTSTSDGIDTTAFGRIEVGWSSPGGGPLLGLLRELVIGP